MSLFQFRMTCCIIGTETLDELENLVISLNFGEIAKKNASRKVWEEGPYDKEQLGVKIEVRFFSIFQENLLKIRALLKISPTTEYLTDTPEGPGTIFLSYKRTAIRFSFEDRFLEIS